MSVAATIGHNCPPAPIELAQPIITGVSAWLADNPVIQPGDQATATAAAAHIDTLRKNAADFEDERKRLVKPLNDEVREINARYKAPTTIFDKITGELKARLTAFARAEEDARRAEAEEKRRAAEDAARKAREAEMAELDARDNAAQGEVGVDLGSAALDAEAAARDAARAERAAAIAEKDAHVKLKAGNARALSLRTVLVFEVVDPVAALIDLPLTDSIREAIISAARGYHKANGAPPAGVTVRTERVV
ncbi:hypothetical protein ACUSIJ_24765 [Pseudochelatococcus sp. B33]